MNLEDIKNNGYGLWIFKKKVNVEDRKNNYYEL